MRQGRWCSLALCGLLGVACAKHREPAATEAPEPAAQDEEKAAERKAAEPTPADEGAPSPAAPPPGAAPRAEQAEGDLLRERAEPLPADIDAAMADLERVQSDFDSALRLHVPNCTAAALLRDRVCELAEHICRLAEQSGDAESQRLCGDGRARCADARKRYSEFCAEP